MARKRSEFLKGFGKAFEILKALTDAVLKRGGSDQDMERILTSKILRDKLADLICEIVQTAKNIFRVPVNYNQNVQDMVKAGKYDWVNSDINGTNFPVIRRGEEMAEVHLIHFNRDITSEEALLELDKMGFKPEELPGLLALGAQHPELQREYPIVALGSAWRRRNGRRGVPCLFRDGSGRNLGLLWFGGSWGAGWRFAAVRKPACR